MRTLNSNPKNKTWLNNKKKITENTNEITNNKESLTDYVMMALNGDSGGGESGSGERK
jgi:hypothetical protein